MIKPANEEVSGIARSLIEKMQLTEACRTSDEMPSNYDVRLTRTSQEIREPLTTMLETINALLKNTLAPEMRRQIEGLKEDAETLLGLVTELIRLSDEIKAEPVPN